MSTQNSPINPAARRAPAGGPPEATNNARLASILHLIQLAEPEVIFRQIKGVAANTIVSFQIGTELFIISVHEYEDIPEEADMAESTD